MKGVLGKISDAVRLTAVRLGLRAHPPHVNAEIARLLRGHGVRAVLTDDAVALPDHGCRIESFISGEQAYEKGHTCRLDVHFTLPGGETVLESFAGVGDGFDGARGDALQNFVRGSFHVLLRGLLIGGADEQVDVEEWRVGGERAVATIGAVTSRGVGPDGNVPTAWFTTLEAEIKRLGLAADLTWIRFYYGHANQATMAVEVLRNNEPWREVEETMAALSWPESDAFYSVRLFLILRRVVQP